MTNNIQVENKDKESFLLKTKGGLIRFAALVLDSSLALVLFSFFLSTEWLNETYKEIHRISLSLNLFENDQFLHHTAPFFILNLFFLFSWRFWTTCIFGVSFFQMLLGLRGGVSFWWNRFGGGVRVLLEFIFIPFIFFELVCLFRYRTLKEFLTYTHVVDRESKFPFIRILIFLPFFISLMLISPLYQNRSLLEGADIKIGKKIKKVKIKISNLKSHKKHYSSNSYKFSSFSSLSNGRFVILPSFDIWKEGAKRKIIPFFTIYDTENSSLGEWRLEKKISLFDLFDKIRGLQPLFSKFYPGLSNVLDRPRRKFIPKNYKGEYQAKFFLNETIVNEIQEYATISFKLNWKNVYKHMIKNGPFFGGYILFKQSLLDFIPQRSRPRIDQISLGNGTFLRLRQDLRKKTFLENEWRETLLSLNSHNALLLSLKWSDGPSPRKSLVSFYQDFFAPMIWYFDYKKLFAFPLKEENMRPFHIGDYYTRRPLSKEKVIVLERYIKKYFFSLAKEKLFSSRVDKKFKLLLVKSVQRMIDIGEIRNKKVKNYYSESYFNYLKRLKLAIVDNDKGHFKKGLY